MSVYSPVANSSTGDLAVKYDELYDELLLYQDSKLKTFDFMMRAFDCVSAIGGCFFCGCFD